MILSSPTSPKIRLESSYVIFLEPELSVRIQDWGRVGEWPRRRDPVNEKTESESKGPTLDQH